MPSQQKPTYRQIADLLAVEIESGERHSGEPIPSINELSKQYGVSRSTVNRALTDLVDKGYLTPMQGKGFFVSAEDARQLPESSDWKIFLSYAHDDDARSGGGITALRQAIQSEYELQTGNEANIFQDTKDIQWGDNWRREIDKSLGVTAFFIPILTPRYLRSPHCLAELQTAVNRFEQLGYGDGIYPIEFVNCSKQIEALKDDALATLLGDTQRKRDWIDLRSEDPQSSAYRKGVREIVERLLEKEAVLEEAKNVRIENQNAQLNRLAAKDIDGEEESEGLLTKLANLEGKLAHLAEATMGIGNDMKSITHVFESASLPENPSPKQILGAVGKISEGLKKECGSLENHCSDYIEDIVILDEGIDAYLEMAELFEEIGVDNNTPRQRAQLHQSIVELVAMTEEPFSQIDSMRKLILQFSKLSPTLKSPCRRIDAALNRVTSSKIIFEGWEAKLQDRL